MQENMFPGFLLVAAEQLPERWQDKAQGHGLGALAVPLHGGLQELRVWKFYKCVFLGFIDSLLLWHD